MSAWSLTQADLNLFGSVGAGDCKVSCSVNIDFAFSGVKASSIASGLTWGTPSYFDRAAILEERAATDRLMNRT